MKSGETTTLKSVAYSVSRTLARVFGRVFWGVRVVGRENIPASGPYIAASSHESFLDPVLVGSVFHRINFLARRTLFETRGRPSRFKIIRAVASPSFASKNYRVVGERGLSAPCQRRSEALTRSG